MARRTKAPAPLTDAEIAKLQAQTARYIVRLQQAVAYAEQLRRKKIVLFEDVSYEAFATKTRKNTP